MRFGRLTVAECEGAILAHGLRCGEIGFKKGRRLTADDIAALLAAGVTKVVVARPDDHEVHEDEAARQLAQRLSGPSIEHGSAFTGRVNLHAGTAGLFVVDGEAVQRLNGVSEGITLATLPGHTVVEPGQMIATVKIIPFAVSVTALEHCLGIAGESGLLGLEPFRSLSAKLLQTELPSLARKVLDKTARVTRERLEALGCRLESEERCAHEVDALAQRISESRTDLLLIAGASAITDRCDVLPAAIEAAGGRVLRFGMPVDPGNLLLLAELDGRPVLGMPGCARSPKLNGLDWVLQRIAAGVPVTSDDIMGMGVGGLLAEIPTRPQPRAGKRKVRQEKIAAIVLAAGQSRRMGARNKLLIPVDGKPMVAHAVDAVIGAGLAPVIVVTGHEREMVRAALRGRDVRIVHNQHFALGLSTSLVTGLAALPPDIDGVLVCLGDMPRVDAALVSRLKAALAPLEGRSIIVPTSNGKRGNPVLWSAEMIPEMRAVEGDVGAKHLIGQFEEAVFEVEIDGAAPLLDIDTPEALAAFESAVE